MDSLIDVLEDAAARFGDRPAFGLRTDDGRSWTWSFRELDRRSGIVAWRLRALGIAPGDRMLTWSPSTPQLPATYFGAIRAGVIFVPLDLRMSSEAIERVAEKADARWLAVGTGQDAPDPVAAGLTGFRIVTLDQLTADPDGTFPADWESQVASWPRPGGEEIFEIVFTSGTTGTPKGVMLSHRSVLANLEAFHGAIPVQEHRVLSLLPLSHLMEQAAALYYALTVGADVLYVRSRNPRVIFEAIREHRVTTMALVPQVLELFWSAIEREVEKQGRAKAFGRLRSIARRLPFPIRRLIFRGVHGRFGGGLNLFISAAAFLPPSLQQAWEDLGVRVLQGYGSTECGMATINTLDDHGPATVGRPFPPAQVRLAGDGEVLVAGPTLFSGYWRDEEATQRAMSPDGWYRTGDIGRFDEGGRLVLMGRTKDMIALPNGMKVYPEDLENELRMAGVNASVVLETRPGRIEALVLGSEAERETIAAAVKAANAKLGQHQRIAAFRLWPDVDFPRTHTLKVKRDQVRAWAVEEAPIPVRQESSASAG